MTAEIEPDRTSVRPEDQPHGGPGDQPTTEVPETAGEFGAVDAPGSTGEEGADAAPSGARQVLHLIRETAQLVVIALLLAFVIKTVAVQAFFIPSGSMLQTLQVGDRVLVEKITYRFGEPERGDIIVFRRPGLPPEGFSLSETWTSFLEGIGLSEPDPERDLIKRIIALPGETVELIEGVVHVDGVPLQEDYIIEENRDLPAVVIPDGEYYVLGDNRGNSLDSRFTLGTVPEENVIGRAFAIIWPPSAATLRTGADYPGVDD